MHAFDYLEKISQFRLQFNIASNHYTHTTAFSNEAETILAAVNVDNADVSVKKLRTLLEQYPDASMTSFRTGQALENIDAEVGALLPSGHNLYDKLRHFARPMLEVL